MIENLFVEAKKVIRKGKFPRHKEGHKADVTIVHEFLQNAPYLFENIEVTMLFEDNRTSIRPNYLGSGAQEPADRPTDSHEYQEYDKVTASGRVSFGVEVQGKREDTRNESSKILNDPKNRKVGSLLALGWI